MVSLVGRMTRGSASVSPAAHGDDGNFGRKAFHVFRFARHEAVRNEEREIGVLMPCRLKAFVQLLLNIFPDGIPVRADDHGSLDGAVIDEFGL